MWKKFAVAGAVGAAVLGAGSAALAVAGDTGSPSPSTPSASPAAGTPKAHKGHHGDKLAGRFEHGEWVSKGKSGSETHEAIRGAVSAISATAISVKADDGFSLTFAVDANTKVVLRENGKGSAKKAAIAAVKAGEHVLVTGVKSGSTLDAKHVVDTGTK